MARKTARGGRGVVTPPAPIKVEHMKPAKFKHYLTLGELSVLTGKDESWLRKLERRDTIPQATRWQLGELSIRLYSPARVREIQRILKTLRPGRPRKTGG